MDILVSQFRRLRRRFVKDERGAVAILVAGGIIALIGVVGLGVDTIRGYIVQSRLSSALDAAGLAGARVMYSDTRDDDIQMYFDANFPDGFMDATVTGPTISVSSDNSVLTLTASADIDTSFMRVLGIDTLAVSSTTEITRGTSMLEVVLAIDVSSSMKNSASGGGTRIAAAVAAALSLTEILFGDEAVSDNLQVALVPWNSKVNVTYNGEAFDSTASTYETVSSFTNPLTGDTQDTLYYANNSPVPLLSEPPEDWQGCVFQRFSDDDDDTNDADQLIGSTSIGGADWPAWEPVITYSGTDEGLGGEPISPGRCDLAVSYNECSSCYDLGITDLTSTRAIIDAAISELEYGGYTNAVQGLVWAWQVLMPTLPFSNAFEDPDSIIQRSRAIILLTDGEQTGISGDGYKAAFGVDDSAQGTMTDNKMNQRLYDLATVIKDEGIVIYTIQFANTSGDLADLLKLVSTGTSSPFYNTAESASELEDVFQEIANDLAELYVSM